MTVTADPATAGGIPDLSAVHNLSEFVTALGSLRAWAGSPSFRTLAKQVGPLLRPPQTVAASTVCDVFQPWRRRLDIDLVTAVVRALGLDAATARRWRDACVAATVAADRGGLSGVSRQLPADLPTFTGRETELAAVLQAADAVGTGGSRTVVVTAVEGMAGVGKTQLVVHAAHRLVRTGRFGDAQLYADLRGFDPELPPADPAAVLEAFLRALDVPAPTIPAERDERAAMFRDRVHGLAALIILDNAADEAQVRDLIPAGPACLVLVTSRRSMIGLEYATVHPLDVFPPAEAVALLARIVGAARVAAEPDAARRIVESCGRLPLAVRLAAARLATRPDWLLADFAARLADTTSRLDRLAVGNLAVRASLTLSLEHLPPTQDGAPDLLTAFRLLGLWTGSDIAVEGAAALFGVDVDTAEPLLEALVDAHLLQSPSIGRYRFHDLVKVFAAEQAATLPAPVRRTAVQGILSWYAHATVAVATHLARNRIQPAPPWSPPSPLALPTFGTDLEAISWCDTERANLLAAIHQAVADGRPELAGPTALNLFAYYSTTRQITGWISSLESIAVIEDQLPPAARPFLHNGLAAAYNAASRFEESIARSAHAAALFRAAADPRGEGAALNNRGLVLARTGHLPEAITVFREAAALFEATGMTFGTVLQWLNIGAAEADSGALDAAAHSLRTAVTLSRTHAHAYQTGKALANLAEVEYLRADLPTARRTATEALDATRRTANRLDEALTLDTLGRVHLAEGDRAAAIAAWRSSLEILEELGEGHAAEVAGRLAAAHSGDRD